MGEAKRRADTEELVKRLTRELTDQGKIVEAGWVSYKMMVLPPDVSGVQLSETRNAYYAGCQHLFGSIMSMLDPDAEPTEDDMRRMDQISTELTAFLEDFKRRHGTGPARRAAEPGAESLGDGPIEQRYLATMNELGRELDKKFNGDAGGTARKNGFVLMVFPFAEGGRINYISNADRRDVVTTLKEQLARFEGQPEISGHA